MNTNLNPQQLESVVHTGAPLLVLAGAGSGKTLVITHKIAHLINTQLVDPFHITAVTFTNKAAREMRQRSEDICAGSRWARICTFHSYGAQFLRYYGERADLNPRFAIYDDEESVSALAILYPNEKKTTLSYIAHKISRAKNVGLFPGDNLAPIDASPTFAKYYLEYQSYLNKIGNVDFGDLILKPLHILRTRADILKEEQHRIRVLLVDEYQDTNRAQYELVRTLYHDHMYLCVVGDDDQSIYRFRGAEVHHIIDFPSQFTNTQVKKLEQNYRSTSPILALAASVVNNNQKRHKKHLWTNAEGGALPQLYIFENDYQEARHCIDAILNDWMNVETAILYRTNAQSRLFESQLIHHSINYKIVGSVRFYAREEIKDLVAFLKFIYNPYDEVSFRRIINKPARGIGTATQQKLQQISVANQCSLVEALSMAATSQRGKNAKALRDMHHLFSTCHDMVHRTQENILMDTLGDLVQFISKESGLEDYYQAQDTDSNTFRLQNIEELIRVTCEYSPDLEGMQAFLERAELEGNDFDHNAPGVTLITMHNTKGLEFERVFVVGLQDGLFPRLTENNLDEIEEERRLLYVAITRAKKELILTSYRVRHLYGRRQENGVTRFIEEVPAELIHRVDYSTQDHSYANDWNGTFANGATNAFANESGTLSPEHPTTTQERAERKEGELLVGDSVYSDEYGAGVISQRKASHEHVVLTVRFHTGKVASFIEKYAALDRVAAE